MRRVLKNWILGYINISLCISWWNAWPGCLELRLAEPSLSHVVEKNTRPKSYLFSINFTSISSRNIRPKSNLFSINFTLIFVGFVELSLSSI